MNPITVAIADANTSRRLKLEQALQKTSEIKVLTNTESSGMGITRNRRRSSRANLSVIDNLIARTRRLAPRVLLVDLEHCLADNGAMLQILRETCPDIKIVVLAKDSCEQEGQIMQAISKGARGLIDINSADPTLISKAVRTIHDGGAWIPRKMLGAIMEQISAWKRT